MGELTLLLGNIGKDGDPIAAARLMPLVYDELRKLAGAKMAREPTGGTLQPTALVHEAWLRLGGEQQTSWQNRAHFFGAAAEAMRRILIDRARRQRAIRHGGGMARVNIDDLEVANIVENGDRLIALSDALEKLEQEDERKARLVKLRYFAGLTIEEVALALDISEPTAKRWWSFARAWLLREIRSQ